ncbi:glutamate--tRNA ligase [Parvularcula dongshanensis]|uniref:Glutamate--tRNA ligase n=1 Tax=Parvularcula dongshanensis TaxID=1173995 RepID=A0A840HYP9_9PROT|nr:glutamate--tRNA ligase [Parvularcula dongshanensis]MBB4657699.1 glutamyl-tRNA synthetase [Parvularcula dongshanensis]
MSATPTPIVTRFAPSPTGYLHIGGARTALFNWLLARGGPEGSKFLLRIEDTDRARQNDDAASAILEGLRWLGLDWDGEPVSQHSRQARHAEVAQALLEKGGAYKCWLAGEDLEAAKARAREANERFTSPYRDGAPGEGPYSVRLKAPLQGDTVIEDAVQGEVRFPNAALDDVVLLRSDGTPTYMLAVVADDHDMGVTHIVRGDDHLTNAARQKHIYEAMGWGTPLFAHVPLIHGQDGKKLSKRHGALGVEAYADEGFLPDGLFNALLKLGWSHGDDEVITRAQALEWFSLGGIGKAPGRLDPDKMRNLNAHHLQALSDEAFVERALPFLGDVTDAQTAMLLRAAPFLKPRCQLLADAKDAAGFLLAERPLQITGKAEKPLRKEGATEALRLVHDDLSSAQDWSAAALDLRLQSLAETHGLTFGQVGPPVRAALTGGNPSPSLGETLHALGRDEALPRLADRL